MADIDRNGNLNYGNFQYISEEVYKILSRYEISNKELMIVIVGATVGKAAMLNIESDKHVILTENCAKITLKDDSIVIPEFILALLQADFFQRQIQREFIQTTLPKLSLERLGSLRIPPIPPHSIQENILKILESAQIKKKAKEQEAKRILASIDEYLLRELGINLPIVEKKKTFYVRRDNIQENRFDPFYHQEYYKGIIQSLKSACFDWSYLKDIVQGRIIKGYLPSADEKEGDTKVIQISSINADGSINLSEVLHAQDVFAPEQQLFHNDILIAITGATIGKTALWSELGEYYVGGDILKFQVKTGINPYFVYSLLRSAPLQALIKRNITGATNGHLSPYDVRHLVLPIPNLNDQKQKDKHNTIATEMYNVRQQAQALRQQANEELQQAKAEVERMILGEEAALK